MKTQKENLVKQGKSALGIVQKYHPNVKRVVDARKPLTISISAQDCKRGKVKSVDHCAMAQAIDRQHDGAIVSTTVAYIVDGDTAVRYKMPASVTREIVSFDRKSGFAPGEYSLCAPTKTQRLGHRQWPQVEGRKGGVGFKARYHKTTGIRSL